MTLGTTPQQQKCLDEIKAYVAAHGHAPSYRQLCDRLGLKSPAAVHRLVHALEDRQLVSVLPRRSRSISIIESRAPAHDQEA